MSKKNLHSKNLNKNTRELLKNINTKGMLLNFDNFVINTKDDYDFSYVKKLMTTSADVLEQIKDIYNSTQIEPNFWVNHQKWGEIFESYENDSDEDSFQELASLEKVTD